MAKRTTKRSGPKRAPKRAPATKAKAARRLTKAKTVRPKARAARLPAKATQKAPKKAAKATRPVAKPTPKRSAKPKAAAKPSRRAPTAKASRVVEVVAPLPAVAATVEPAEPAIEETTQAPEVSPPAATNGPSTSSLELIVKEVEASLPGITKDEALDVVVDALAQVAHYNWIGIYLLDGDTLVLGHFRGAETEHVRIPIGQGICGLAARTAQTVNVPDVNKDPRYLACFLNTRSELVVPIFDPHGRVVGEIDIDSDTANAFTQVDESVVERIARLLTPFFAEPDSPEKEPERFIGTN